LAWQERAACAGTDSPDDWYGLGGRAGQVCQGCPVQENCLDDAMSRGDPFGIWGGLGPDVRRDLGMVEQDVSETLDLLMLTLRAEQHRTTGDRQAQAARGDRHAAERGAYLPVRRSVGGAA
jgi:WhiB family redox-sensing transcriptional regulator